MTATLPENATKAWAPHGFDYSKVNPALSDKYSGNLYAFLTKKGNEGFARRARVHLDKDKTMWLGYMDDTGLLTGVRMNHVLCFGVKATLGCICNLGELEEVKGFWEQYLRDGRCAIDREHTTSFINGDARWETKGRYRHCLWCGKAQQHLVTKTETRVVTTHAWENVGA